MSRWADVVGTASVPPAAPDHGEVTAAPSTPHVERAVVEKPHLPPKEADQLRLQQALLRKQQRAEQERELLHFRHEQTVKRWEAGRHDVKPSKVLFLSDFLQTQGKPTKLQLAPPLPPPVTTAASKERQPPRHVDAAACVTTTAAVVDSSSSPSGPAMVGGMRIHRNQRRPVDGPPSGVNRPTQHTPPPPSTVTARKKPAKLPIEPPHTSPPSQPAVDGLLTTATRRPHAQVLAAIGASGGALGSGSRAGRTEKKKAVDDAGDWKPPRTAAGTLPSRKVPTDVKRMVYGARAQIFDRVYDAATAPIPPACQPAASSSGSDDGMAEAVTTTQPHQASTNRSTAMDLVEGMRSHTAAMGALYEAIGHHAKQGETAEARKLLRQLRKRKKMLARMVLVPLPADADRAQDNRQSDKQLDEGADARSPSITRKLGGDCSEVQDTEEEKGLPSSGGADDFETIEIAASLLMSSAPPPTADAATIVKPQEELHPNGDGSVRRRPRCSFYPSLLQLGVGLHPHGPLIDQRRASTSSVPSHCDGDADINATGRTFTGNSGNSVRGVVREYCVNCLTDALDDAATAFLVKLHVAQKKLKTQQPLHFKARMRYQCGLREVMRSLAAKRVRLVLVAPDVEPVPGEGALDAQATTGPQTTARDSSVKRLGLDGSVRAIVDRCAASGVPWVCCLSRARLGQSLRLGASRVSVVAVLSAESAYPEFKELIALARASLEAYTTALGGASNHNV